MSETQITPPLSLNEAGLELRDASGTVDPAIQTAHTALADARGAAENLASAINATMQDPSLTQAQRTLKSTRLSEQLSETIARRLDSGRNAIATQISAIESSREWALPKATTARDIAIESEVRSVLRAMTPEQRMAALNSAIASNQTEILSAAFGGPSLLIAAESSQRDALLNHWRSKHSPAWQRHEKLKRAAQRIEQAGGAAVSWLSGLSAETGLEALVNKATEARAAAEAAAKAA